MTYKAALDKAKKMTRQFGKEASAAQLLMLHFSGLEPTELYLKYEEEMPQENADAFFAALNEHLNHNKPVQQLIGYVYFYGYKMTVTDQVLIPRFETEELVANVLMLYDEYFNVKNIRLADVGTGSGCLAIALKMEEPERFDVVATDISDTAIEVAKKNAENLGCDITFLVGDMINPLLGQRFDILVSNPPYIPESENVEDIIFDHEPHLALFGGEDGLQFYRQILENAGHILNDQAIIAFEHGYDKGEELRLLAKLYFPDARIYTEKDMQGLDRMTFVIKGFDH